jgi:TP901 family phage tail tape measure protein
VADRTAAVKLTLRNEGFVAGLRQAKAQTKDFADTVQQGAERNKGSLDTLTHNFTAVGLAAGAAFGLAVAKFADFDAAMSGVQAATHESAANMAALREAAIQAGKDTAFSATEAASAIENLAKAGVSTKDILGGGLNGALSLAAAGELAVGDAAEIAATAMTQFKLSGKDIPHIADLLAAGAGKAQGEVSDMAMALKQSGLVAAQFGLSIEETTGTLSAFAAAGLIGSDAGTSFKTMLLALANPSVKAANTMKELGIAAYDTQGNFVGIAPLAEQLKNKLSDLAPAQRDAALATIFGSDAIRAANVLYQNGAAGIVDWTNKVNDQGYAAETAALKTDNLKGDLERLGGAIDTALIQSGEGANDALRKIVQGADAAVTAFSDLPGWVQKGSLALAGLVGAGALGAAGLIKGVQAASELRGALQKLGTVSSGLKFSMGAVGVALAAAVTVFGAFAKQSAESKQHVQEFRDTLDQATGAITDNTRAYVANELAQNGLAQKAKDFGLNLAQVTDAALGNKDALAAVIEELDKVAEANEIVNSGTKTGVTRYNEQGEAARALQEEIRKQSGALSEAQHQQELAAEGAKENDSAQVSLAEATEVANKAFKEEKASLEDVIDAMHVASGAALELSGAQIGVQAAIDDAAKAAAENGKTLNINTEAGRANRSALDDLAKAANNQTDAMLKAGKSDLQAAEAAKASQKSFVEQAVKMGLSKKQAEALAQSLIDIPNVSREAKLTANKKDLEDKLAKARKELADPNLTKTRQAQLKAEISKLEAGIREANRQLNSVPPSKTVTITTRLVTERIARNVSGASGGHVPAEKRASGGPTVEGQLYKVGEEGPEYWVAPADGFILNANQTRQIDANRFSQTTAAPAAIGESPRVDVAAPAVRVFIGNEEITDRIQVVVDRNNQQLKRDVRQGVFR